jgi:alpha-glucuronidase
MINQTLDDVFNIYDDTVKSVADIRKKLISKLEKITEELEISDDDSASKLEAKLGIVNTLDSVLKSYESGFANNIKVKLQNKNIDKDTSIKEQAVEILKQISISSSGIADLNKQESMNKAIDIIEQRVSDECTPISDDELADE